MAKLAKGRGNAAFSSGDFQTAIKEFTAAIELDATDHVFYSNRSGAYASLNEYDKALEDASSCIKIKPEWVKGYTRKGLALVNLGKLDEATATYEEGLKLDSKNAGCLSGLEEVEKARRPKGGNPFGNLFGPDMWAKLAADPTTREYLNDPAFVQKLKMMQSNPNMMGSMMSGSDPKMSAAIGVILGLGSGGFSTMNPGGPGGPGGDADGDVPMREQPQAKPAQKPREPEPEPEEELDAELEAEKKLKADAAAEKLKGNEFYKKKQFAEALSCYDKAIEKDPTNISFQTNKAAVFFEQKDYDKAIETCRQAIKDATSRKGYDYKMVAKAWFRIGNCLDKQGKFEETEEAYNKCLLENPLPEAKTALKKLAAKKKKADELAYLDPIKSEEHKAQGNEHFKAGKWIDAIGEYTEALRRDPTNYKIYSNRAACYTKLMDWERGQQDCDKCISMEPTFVKAYIRKAKIQHFLKQYHKAIETYQKGLELDPQATELIEGRRATMQAINNENQSGNVDPSRAKEAMKDPEIQAILQDPLINKVIKDMQSDPEEGQRALADPGVREKIEKLIAAGILQVGSR